MTRPLRPREAEGSGRARLVRSLLAAVGVGCLIANGVVLVMVSRLDVFAWIRVTYDIDTLALPLVLFGAGMVALAVGRRREVGRSARRATWAFLVAAAVLLALRVWATGIEPHLLKVRIVSFGSAKVDRPLRILHLSDLQSARVGRWEARVFARARRLEPDIVLYTGDLMQPVPPASVDSELPKLLPLLEALSPPLGCYAVRGNTDSAVWGGGTEQLGCLRLLEDREASVSGVGVRLRLLGLSLHDSNRPQKARARVESWLGGADEGELTVLLGHVPNFILGVEDLPVDLCLAGHTHGGQIRLPWFGPLVTLSAVPRSWARGFRPVGRTLLDVSAGIGAEHAAGLPSIRFNCPPEMTLITVEPLRPRA